MTEIQDTTTENQEMTVPQTDVGADIGLDIDAVSALFDRAWWTVGWYSGSLHASPLLAERYAYDHSSMIAFRAKQITAMGFRVVADENGLRVYERVSEEGSEGVSDGGSGS